MPSLGDVLPGLPKAVLHDHLDGGLRVETVLELAETAGYEDLPAGDAESLAAWFFQEGSSSLESYLESFAYTVAVMQTPAAVERVAYEAVVDLAADGVVYCELRFAPSLHLRGGMHRRDVLAAAAAGMRRGTAETGTVAYMLVDALRQHDDSELVARAAVDLDDAIIVGFDLAGPEAGFPASDHLPALRHIRESSLSLTLHAGEGDGPWSIWDAWARCGAQRLGHGARIIEDTRIAGGAIVGLGRLAAHIRDGRVPLELCITSNIQTGMYPTVGEHPVGALHRAGFNVTLNTDNRLMSRTSMSAEMRLAVEHHGLSTADLGMITEQTVVAGFGPWPQRRRLVEEVIRPAYAAFEI